MTTNPVTKGQQMKNYLHEFWREWGTGVPITPDEWKVATRQELEEFWCAATLAAAQVWGSLPDGRVMHDLHAARAEIADNVINGERLTRIIHGLRFVGFDEMD